MVSIPIAVDSTVRGRPHFYRASHLDGLTARAGLTADERLRVRAVAAVLPFRVNEYVIDELIDWSQGRDDAIYRMVFPQPDMLPADDVDPIVRLLRRGASAAEIQTAASAVRLKLNPQPAGQLDLNVPRFEGEPLTGVQHKYAETVLYFPARGQTCHAYCSYCFRWAQFVAEPGMKMAAHDTGRLVRYLRRHREVTDVLITGGDPMMMSADRLARCVMPLVDDPALGHIETIRIGTKALAYWPHKFVSDPDADDMLRLFERVASRGKRLAFMAHFTHPRELETDAVARAVSRVLATGVVIRTQGPVIRSVNDSARHWSSLWRTQVRMGMVPYYQFVERDTGPRNYFEVPLVRSYEIFTAAYRSVGGLCRTVRGPVMSATPGKVVIDGVLDIGGERAMVLRFLQSRDPSLVNRPWVARYDPSATWLDDLRPLAGGAATAYESLATS
jgi:L-lysine 2,3-aminomutase